MASDRLCTAPSRPTQCPRPVYDASTATKLRSPADAPTWAGKCHAWYFETSISPEQFPKSGKSPRELGSCQRAQVEGFRQVTRRDTKMGLGISSHRSSNPKRLSRTSSSTRRSGTCSGGPSDWVLLVSSSIGWRLGGTWRQVRSSRHAASGR